jgi:hypothetical protein
MEKVAKAVLRDLFQKYLENPTVLYSINAVADLYKTDAVALSNFLVERNWIREPWIYQNNVVACKITVQGIEEINPSFIRRQLKEITEGLISGGGRRSLMSIFQNKLEVYAIALDMIYQLEKLGLVNILHIKGEIEIELTAQGWKFAENHGKSLLTLMVA